MKLKSVKIEHTNPSMGPHETVVTYSMNIDNQQMGKDLLEKSTVNGVATLAEYAAASIAKNYSLLEKIAKKTNSERLNQGTTISNFYLNLEGGEQVVLNDLRVYRISGYYDEKFLPVLINDKNKSVWSEKMFKDELENLNLKPNEHLDMDSSTIVIKDDEE